METIKKRVSFGEVLTDDLKLVAMNKKGFVRFLDEEYFEVEVSPPTDKDFVYFKRNNGEIVVA